MGAVRRPVRAGVVALVCLAAWGIGGSAGAAPPDPFRGTWKSIDVDGSNQTLSFGGVGETRMVHLFDDFASLAPCSGGPATGTGVGSVDGTSIAVEFFVGNCETKPLSLPGNECVTGSSERRLHHAAAHGMYDPLLTWMT